MEPPDPIPDPITPAWVNEQIAHIVAHFPEEADRVDPYTALLKTLVKDLLKRALDPNHPELTLSKLFANGNKAFKDAYEDDAFQALIGGCYLDLGPRIIGRFGRVVFLHAGPPCEMCPVVPTMVMPEV